ncbi:threonylcarbamoyl-AMP synthase [Weizmannia acidilactici]|uniref:L-threonylcarbamoyladenylate synthase n=1 Tax=Weizmannia acidilactici TaxID=2607726 RepID=UPI00124EF5E0|nr:L-threonylcarbamoyladenylate synthase [Weizmannia acidilactici]GER66369.1 threonylcarbamoyl-AMP synthase [Weizmannia acidilactici]
MDTKYWFVDKTVENLQSYPQLVEAAQLLKEKQAVAFPTETVYGLGADATSDEAVDKIYKAKGRPSDNPLIVHIADEVQLEMLAEEIPDMVRALIKAFWPGPLTLILKVKKGKLSQKVTAGLDTVGIRMPAHPVALALIRLAGFPIAAPSANRSGKPSPTTAGHVRRDLDGKIAGIVDGGETGVGVESTVLDCTADTPVILRPGGITKEQLEEVIGEVQLDPGLENENVARPKAPGMKYTHYAPNAPVYLVDGGVPFMQRLIDERRENGENVGAVVTEETAGEIRANTVAVCGRRSSLETVAHHLYDSLRSFDDQDVDVIFCETFPRKGIGQAIMNRLEKAAGHRLISENPSGR